MASRKKVARRGRGSDSGAKPSPKPPPGKTAFPEIEALAELMDRHGLVEVTYESDPDGARRIHVSRAGRGPVGPLPGPAAPAGGVAAARTPAAMDEGLHAFKSPMVGTFYRAPSPETPPFVSLGDTVDASTVICIIEAMKVMNEITPDVDGEIVSIEVENGEAVEFGQTLMLIRPR